MARWCCLMLMTSLLMLSMGHTIQESEMIDLPQRLQELLLIRRLINNMNAAEAAMTRDSQPDVKKRTCYINAGLSHGCDYKDLVGAMAEKNYWDSLNSPGRRRRRSLEDNYLTTSSLEVPL
ncbi:hypothetical protein OTU49_012572 [Cherax quadricarinatus]|uniref:Uncharacterized protein n=1 Tax=Cherax quadricarinatus TaxID=27406 RepID=A0AAW0VXV6_CHEQU